MPDIGVPELLIIIVVILLLFGPGRIAKMGGELGKGIREFRQGLQGDKPAKALTAEEEEPLPDPLGSETSTVEASANPPTETPNNL